MSTFTHALSTNNYGPAKFIVSAIAANGTHTTIASANAASSLGDTIFIRDATITENVTILPGRNYTAWTGSDASATCTVIGKWTMTGAGSSSISNILMQTNSDFIVEVSGANACNLTIDSVILDCINNTGISFTNSNASSSILITESSSLIQTTGICTFVSTSAGALTFTNSTEYNIASSTTQNTFSDGILIMEETAFGTPISVSGDTMFNTRVLFMTCDNVTAVTTAGTVVCNFYMSSFNAGSASSISIGSGTIVNLFIADVASTNTNAITGAGTLNYGSVLFTGSSSTINTSVQIPIPWPVKQGGTGVSSFTPYSVITGGTTSTGPLQNVSGVGTSGQVLTSNGAAMLPTWQNAAATGITTIDGDIGTGATGSTITFDANTNSGATVLFDANGSTVEFIVSDGSLNILIGDSAGNNTLSGSNNTGLGVAVLNTLTTGSSNTAIGENCMVQATSCVANVGVGINVLSGNGSSVTGSSNVGVGANTLQSLTSGSNNAALGGAALQNILTGSNNIALGQIAGTNYNTSESNNIIIGNDGTTSDANTIRIGTQGSGTSQQNTCFVAGITGVSVSNLNMVTIDTTTGQLGSQAFAAAPLTITTITSAASPYTVLSTDQFLRVNTTGGAVTINIPNSTTTGRVLYVKDSNGTSATNNITVTTPGGTVTFDGATTNVINTNFKSINVIFDGTNYEVF